MTTLDCWRDEGCDRYLVTFGGRTLCTRGQPQLCSEPGRDPGLRIITDGGLKLRVDCASAVVAPLAIRFLDGDGLPVILAPEQPLDENLVQARIDGRIRASRGRPETGGGESLLANALDAGEQDPDNADHEFIDLLASMMFEGEALTIRRGSEIEYIAAPYESIAIRDGKLRAGRIVVPLDETLLCVRNHDRDPVHWSAGGQDIWITSNDAGNERIDDFLDVLEALLECEGEDGSLRVTLEGDSYRIPVDQIRIERSAEDAGDAGDAEQTGQCLVFGSSLRISLAQFGWIFDSSTINHAHRRKLMDGQILSIGHGVSADSRTTATSLPGTC